MDKEKGKGHRRRVKDKVLSYGVESLYDYEFLELCLFYVHKQKDTKRIAKDLIEKFKTLENVCNAPEKELCTVKDVGPSTVEFLRMLPLISKGYALNTSTKKHMVYEHKSDVENRCKALLKNCVNEKAFILCFDDRKHLIKEVEISDGEPGRVNINLRKIMDAIANTTTTGVVLCHNHPSGSLMPSQEDKITTRDIRLFLESANIELIEHYIVAGDRSVACIPVN